LRIIQRRTTIYYPPPPIDSHNKVDFHKVQILDPAAGTGTFLAEVIEKIYSNFANNKGAWQGYCTDHLIPRINGFEILMASYAMAHFKLDMKLKETGCAADAASRLKVYLTNSLEEPPKDVPELFMEKWLTDEALEANNVKKNTPVMVVLGNPPYSGESANITSDEFLAPYKKEPGGKEKLKERNPKWLNDDYVKFIRYGQTFIEKYGAGVLAFINNHGFLDNPTFRGMRWHLLAAFDKIYIFNLHGNSRKKETCPDGSKDENVFDIQQGVSVNLFIKTGMKKNDELAQVFYSDLYGTRKYKYDYLDNNDIAAIQWDEIKPESSNYFLVNKIFDNKAEYEKGFSINEMFPVNSVGIVTGRDDLAIQMTRDKMKKVINDFAVLETEEARNKYNLGKDARDWSVKRAQEDLIKTKLDENNIREISYRPFDARWTYYSGNSRGFQCMARARIMGHLLLKNNVGIIFTRCFTENAPPVFISNHIIAFRSWSRPGMQGGDYIAPLYLYPEKGSLDKTEKRRPNLNNEIVQIIAQKTKLQFTEEKLPALPSGMDEDKTFAPLDILDYIYAVLHSPAYRAKYKELLKLISPAYRIPQMRSNFAASPPSARSSVNYT
jgi:predicted helicase